MDAGEPIAITPVDHGVILRPDALTELIIKKDTHLYRLRSTRKSGTPPNKDRVYRLEHRFESMASWNWVATYVDSLTGIAGLCSIMGYPFGKIRDGSVIEAESFIGPTGNLHSDNGEIWFEPTENSALFVTSPDHLPIGFGSKGTQSDHYELALNSDGGYVSVGHRENFDNPWEMVDKVEDSITKSVHTLCDLADLPYASPPTHKEIRNVWEEAGSEDEQREFQ